MQPEAAGTSRDALARAVLDRVGDVVLRVEADADRDVRAEAVARLRRREDDRARPARASRTAASRPVREDGRRPRRRRAPVRDPVDVRRQEQQARGERGGALERRTPARARRRAPRRAPTTRDPRRPRGAAVLERVAEVAGVERAGRRSRRRARAGRRAGRAAGRARPSRPRARTPAGRKPGEPPRLRERDDVGERREEPRDEADDEDGERAADDVRRPAAPRVASAGERDQQQGGDRDRARPDEELGRRPQKRSSVPSSWPAYCSKARVALGRVRAHRRGVADHGQEPGEERRRRERRARRARGRRRARPVAPTASGRRGSPTNGIQRKSGVRRVDDGEHERRRRGRRERAARDGCRVASSASASAAGTRSCREPSRAARAP